MPSPLDDDVTPLTPSAGGPTRAVNPFAADARHAWNIGRTVHTGGHYRWPLEKAPAVLGDRAQQILADFGYAALRPTALRVVRGRRCLGVRG